MALARVVPVPETSDSLSTAAAAAATADTSFQWLHLLHAFDQPKRERDPPADHQKYLPGWPLLPSTPAKLIDMHKCNKCSKQFCSTINYRRHIRMHRPSPNIDKDFQKNRHNIAMFWDKLALEEMKDVVSLADVDIEGTSGTTILKYLSLWIHRPNISSLPSEYVQAGTLLLEIVQGKPGSLPVTSKELFTILDDASEHTFMSAGNATLVQKFLFDGDAEKIIIEMKNLIACMSYLLELKLVRAWIADKAAEALRCQKLLVEEEEAAQKRKSELIEKKRLKKLRQRKEKLNDASDPGNKAASELVADVVISPRIPGPTAQSELEVNHAQIENDDLAGDVVYTEDSKVSGELENKQENSCDKVDTENERGPVLSDNLEVLIGSISIAVEDTSLTGSGSTPLRSVDYEKGFFPKDARTGQMGHLKDDMQSESVASYGKNEDSLDMRKEPFVMRRCMASGPRLFCCKEASAFLAQRWSDAMASDHVTLVLPP